MKKILIVEDHADIRRLIRMTLELEDYEIHEATNAAEGWAAAQAVQAQLEALKAGVAEETIAFAPTGVVVLAAGEGRQARPCQAQEDRPCRIRARDGGLPDPRG